MPTGHPGHPSCSEEGCEQPSHARGMCRRHYMAWYHRSNRFAMLGPPPRTVRGASRTVEEDRRAVALVAFLRTLDEWNVARYCELVLHAHLGAAIEVRQERRRVPRAA